MQLRRILVLSLTLLVGILIGRISSGGFSGAKSETAGKNPRNSPTAVAPEDPSGKPKRSHERPAPTTDPGPETVNVRLKDLRNFISGRSIQPRGFERAEQDLDPLFSLLGLTNLERDAVKIAFEQTQREFYETEKRTVRVKDADSSRVVLDLSGMENLHAGLTENARQRILSSLDPERAAIVEKAIDWDGFYPFPRNGEMKLSLRRKNNGLWIVQDGGSYSRETRLNGTKFPVGSQSVPASAAFGPDATSAGTPDRWSHFLGDTQLVPSDAPDSDGG